MEWPTTDLALRIGTRGSPLAQAQAHAVRDALMAAHGLGTDAFRIEVIRTTGDRVQDRPLREISGKGLFTREIEEALSDGAIDIAVHSVKDLPSAQPPGLVLDCFLPRADPRDAFISPRVAALADLPGGALVGTSSLRRQAQVLRLRPDLKVGDFRGNVDTRLRRLAEGQAAATFLAMAGLGRLGLGHVVTAPMAVEDMLPAVGQGAIGIERRGVDDRIAMLLAPLNHQATAQALAAERSFLSRLDGSCRTPIAGLAVLDGEQLWLRGEILAPDGSSFFRGEARAPVGDAAAMGRALAERLLATAPKGFLAS